jgi:hypothetical protein
MHVKKGEIIASMEDQQYIQLQQDYLTIKSKLNFYENEFNRQKYDCSILDSIVVEDTMEMSAKKYGKKKKLGELYKLEFNEEMENAHSQEIQVATGRRELWATSFPSVTCLIQKMD